MSWIGPHWLDLSNKTRNCWHRGRRGSGIELRGWYQERMGIQVNQKWCRVHLMSHCGPSWVEYLWSFCTNYGGIDVSHEVFSWGAIIHLLVNPGMVDDTSFLLVVRVYPDLMVRVGGIKGFTDIGCIWGDKMFGRYIVEWGCVFARCCWF